MTKTATAAAICGKGEENKLTNYRPILVLPVLSKIFGDVLLDRLSNFFAHRNIISKAQYGLRKGWSIEQALLHIKYEIMKNVEEKNLTLGLFLDLRKALDPINHTILLNKLGKYGIRGVKLPKTQDGLYALERLGQVFKQFSAACRRGQNWDP